MINITQTNCPDGLNWQKCRAKQEIISAVKMDQDFIVRSNNGDTFGFRGDFLVMGVCGELFRVAKEVFVDTYDIIY